MRTNYFPIAFMFTAILLFTNCSNDNPTTQGSYAPTDNTTPTPAESPKEEKKTDNEIIAENAVKLLENTTDAIIKNKQYKDSVRAANKQEFWAYVIGVPFNDMDQAAEAFDQLKGIDNLAIFEFDDEYSLIKTGDSEEQLTDGQGAFKEQLSKTELINKDVHIRNLSIKCGKKDHIVFGQNRKFRKKHGDISCYVCN